MIKSKSNQSLIAVIIVAAIICIYTLKPYIIGKFLELKQINNPPPPASSESGVKNELKGSRGYNNNNPGNLRISAVAWKGKISKDKNTDKSFEQFTTLDYGIRAAAYNLKAYLNQGVNTLPKMLKKWAPGSDGNNESAYAASVRANSHIKNFDIKLTKESFLAVLPNFLYAMFIVENGKEDISIERITQVVQSNLDVLK